MDILYRDAKKKDYKDIKRLIGEAWFDEYMEEYGFKPWVVELYRKGYIYMYLAESNYIKVAEADNKVVGFLFGRIKKASFFKALKYRILLYFVGLRLLLTKAGRRGLKINRITNITNKRLIKNSKMDLESELCLFIVDENYRNLHIGSKLHKDFLEHLEKIGIKNNYLFTDTYSDYFYYERRGYVRKAELEVNFGMGEEDENDLPKYYIYVKEW